MIALKKKVLFSRKNYVDYVYQNHNIVAPVQLFQFY